MWQVANSERKNKEKGSSKALALEKNGDMITEPQVLAETFNTAFLEKPRKISETTSKIRWSSDERHIQII